MCGRGMLVGAMLGEILVSVIRLHNCLLHLLLRSSQGMHLERGVVAEVRRTRIFPSCLEKWLEKTDCVREKTQAQHLRRDLNLVLAFLLPLQLGLVVAAEPVAENLFDDAHS